MRTPRLNRDGHQWIYDWIVKETGRVFHWDEEGRELPGTVKSHGQYRNILVDRLKDLKKSHKKKSKQGIHQLHLTYITEHQLSLQLLNIQY